MNLIFPIYTYIYISGIVIPTDELIVFRGVGIPPTSKALGKDIMFEEGIVEIKDDKEYPSY